VARERGLNAVCIPSKGLDREVYDRLLAEELKRNSVDLVCLAGFMRLLSAGFHPRIPVAHPQYPPLAGCPAFPGLDAQHQALEHGVKVGGCTVHFVDECLDFRPDPGANGRPRSERRHGGALSARILKEEHRIYTEAINLVLAGNFRIEGRRVVFT